MTTKHDTKAVAPPAVDVAILTKPTNADAVPQLLEEITAGVSALETGGDEARHNLIIKARSLIQALETPRETMIKHCWAQTGAMGGIIYGVESGLWDLMARNGDVPQKVEDLATALGVDANVLGRFLRHLSSMGYVTETAEDEYQPNNFCKALSIPIMNGGYTSILAHTSSGPIQYANFARDRKWAGSTDATDTSMMKAYNTKLNMFDHLQGLGKGPDFNNHMGGYRQGRLPWMVPGFFPVEERLINGADAAPNAPFLVDIGGSVGHDLLEFQRHHPNHPGKLILQDLPVVIDQIVELDPKIERMNYDFHTEQPVKGARAYYMHSCLHDWPDNVCASILARVKEAMKPSYSRLLINENVIPKTNAYWETSALDMVMLCLFNSKERTESDWYHLLEDIAGLKIIQIWTKGCGVESIIECEIPAL